MNYPNFIDHDNIYCYKFYDINIMERNCMYPFTYNTNNINDTNATTNKNEIVTNNININNFIKLPNFDNMILDINGLPYIQLNI